MNIHRKSVRAERHSGTLSSKFQISIPKAVREAQGWGPGQKLAFLPHDGGILLIAVPELSDLRGIAKGADKSNYRDRDDRY